MFEKYSMVLLFIVAHFPLSKGFQESYRFKLDIGNPDVICPRPNYTCTDGLIHYLCTPVLRVNPRCTCYVPVPLPAKMIRTFVQGTNGIRNKVAMQYNIANMNLVYWSEELRHMAERFLLECKRSYDPCLVIGEKLVRVSQNYALLKGQIADRWPGRVVRHWYMELGADADDWETIEHKYSRGEIGNFTNMIYPLVEFIGCAAARFTEGYFIICYYHPPFNNKTAFNTDFTLGEACSSCIYSRSTCSRTFSGLCGVDMSIREEKAGNIKLNVYLLILCITFTNSLWCLIVSL